MTLAGCGGGPGQSPVLGSPTSSPTTTPTNVAATPLPSGVASTAPTTAPSGTASTMPSTAPSGTASTTPTVAPSAAASPAAVNFHPSNNGTTFAYAGQSLTIYDRSNQYPSPEPTQTTTVAITQSVTVTNPVGYAGNANAIDYATTETDSQTAPAPQTSQTKIDSYYAYTNSAYAGNFMYLGFTTQDTYGDTYAEQFPSGGVIADMLPEAAGQAWTNPPTATISQTIPNNQTISETIAANGTYTETITYQNVGSSNTTATVTSNLDGSGKYMTPRLGTRFDKEYVYAVTAPDASGTITATTIIPPATPSPAPSGSTPAPEGTPTVVTTTVPSWIPQGFLGVSLQTETDKDMGPVAIPASCNVPTSYGSSANEVVQAKQRVDPMLGQLETTTTTNLVVPNVGLACVAIVDKLVYYYDFTGQNGAGYFSGTPQQTTTFTEYLGLSQEQLQAAARTGGRRFALSRGFGARVELALAHIASARAMERAEYLRSGVLRRHFDAHDRANHGGIL